MMSDEDNKDSVQGSPPIHWVVSAFCITFLIVCSGITYSYGVFLPSLAAEYALEIDAVAAIFSLFLVIAAISAYICSRILNRVSSRIIIPISGVIAGLGLFFASKAGSIGPFVVNFGIVSALGMGSIWTITLYFLNSLIPRNHIVFITITGICSGMMIIPPVCGWLVTSYSWEDAFLFLSILAWVVFVPIGPFTIKNRDEMNGVIGKDAVSNQLTSYTFHRIKRNFWLSLGLWIFLAFTLHMILIHLVAHAAFNDISIQRASYLMCILGAVSIISAVGIGSVTEIFDRKSLSIIFALVGGIAIFWIIDAEQFWKYCIFVLLYAPTLGGIGYFALSFTRKYIIEFPIGHKLVASIGGWLIGGAIGTYLGGYLFEVVGDYRFAFFIGAWICVLAGACIWHLVLPGQQSERTVKQADHASK